MKNNQYFKGPGGLSEGEKKMINTALRNLEFISLDSKLGFLSYCYYYITDNKLYYTESLPSKLEEITFEEFKNWILNYTKPEPQYEIY